MSLEDGFEALLAHAQLRLEDELSLAHPDRASGATDGQLAATALFLQQAATDFFHRRTQQAVLLAQGLAEAARAGLKPSLLTSALLALGEAA